MSLMHDFFLIKTDNISLINEDIDLYDTLFNNNKNINLLYSFKIPDTFFSYFNDYLNWIPTKLIINNELINSYGFNYYSFTLIDKSSSSCIEHIFKSLIDLFSQSTDMVTLTGDFEFKNQCVGKYSILKMDKQYLIKLFNEFIYISQELKKDNTFVIHYGI
jgi:hypothetical protein